MGSFTMDYHPLPFSYIGFALLIVLYAIFRYATASTRVDVPAIGAGSWLESYKTAYRYLFDPRRVLQEGYDKYKNATFQIPQLHGWMVVVSGHKLIEELRSAPDESFSFLKAVDQRLCLDYTIGHQIHDNPYHAPIVRSQLTRNIGALFNEIRDEIAVAFDDLIHLDGDNWTPVTIMPTIRQVICRTSNRLFVGLPLCRDEDYIKLNVQYTQDVVICGDIISQFPTFFKPFVAWMLGLRAKSLKTALRHLGPLIDESLRVYEEYGKGETSNPNTFLSWLIDEAEGKERSREWLALRMLFINFAAIHTTSNTFTQALFHLASQPHYIGPMREEVEAVVRESGWNKVALTKMHKVDSFLKEAARYNGINVISVERLALRDYTFQDGTFIPKGTLLCAASGSTHFDDSNYKNANVFDGFRFSDIRENKGEEVKHQMVSTTWDFLTFGHGSRACPGRFFAANELKTIMAHLLLNYDMKMEKEGQRPADTYYFAAVVPDNRAQVLFRRRQKPVV